MIGLVVSNLSNRLKQLAQEKRISVRALERIMNVANGYVSRIGETMGADKAENILQAFPDVSRNWLLFGEGDMMGSSSNVQIGDGDLNYQGNTTNNKESWIYEANLLERAIAEIGEQRKLVTKAQEQIDRLLSIIEMKNNK